MRIFLMGGTGLVGTRLIERLLERKDEVVLLTRRPEVARTQWGERCRVVQGDPMQSGAWQDGVAECDAVVNLVGEGVFKRRWSAELKQLLVTSRVQSTTHAVQALARNPKDKVLVNASAIGYYGPHGDEELDEHNGPGSDTMAQLCIEWERAATAATALGIRVALLRIGVVLDKAGGALKQMLLPFKMFAGGPIGSGKQYLSWIHHADLVGILLLALDNAQASGPLNGTAPQPVTNKAFSKALGRALHRPSFMPTPGFMLRVMLGGVAEIVTTGQRVLPRRALALGYAFQFPEIDAALQDVLK